MLEIVKERQLSHLEWKHRKVEGNIYNLLLNEWNSLIFKVIFLYIFKVI